MTGRMLKLVVRSASLLLAWALAAHVAHAQWTPSGVAGQSTAPLSDPGKALALASAARVLVVGQDDNRLAIVNPDTGVVLGQVNLPYEPQAVAVRADGTRAYVVYGNSKLTAVNVTTRTVIATWTIGGDLRSLALMPGEAEIAIADSGPNRLLKVNASSGVVMSQLSLAHEPREVIRGNGDAKLIVGATNGWLITVDGGSFSVLSQLKLADEIRTLTWWEAGARALVVHKRADAASLVNVATNQVTATVQLDGDPDRAAVAAGTGYIATHDDASINRVDLAGPSLLGRYAIAARVSALVFDPAANVLYGALRSDQKLVRLDPAAASLISVLQLQKRLRDVAVNPATHEAVAVADKSDEMFVIKLADRSVRQIALPARPDLVAVDSQLNRAVVAFRGYGGAKLRFADLAAGTLYPQTISYDRDLEAIAVDSTRSLALAIADGNRPVLVIDVNTRARLADGPADRYRALALHSGRGVAYLATEDRRLKVMDLATRAIIGTLELGFKVNAITVDEVLDKAVLTTDSSNRAHVLNLATLGIESSHTLPSHPGASALQADTHVVVVASQESDKVSLVNLGTATATIVSGFTAIEKAHAVAVSARYNQALVLSGERDEMAFVQLPNPVPVLETLAPTQAPSGNPGLVLTLNGKGFVDASKAYFGASALVTRWISATRLEADVPAAQLATARTVQVTVQNPAPAGGVSNALPFIVGGTPILSAISPNSGPADGLAKPLTLTGQNFASGAVVLFGVTSLPATVQSGSSLTVTVPGNLALVPGVVQVSVLNPGGQLSNSLPFTLVPSLAITAVTPASGEVGTLITLTGNGFDPNPASNTIVFRGINNTLVGAVPLTASATQITLRVPPLAETGPIALTNSRGIVQSPVFTVTREQDFQLVVSPAALTVYQGASNSVQAQLSSTGSRSFTGLVTLAVQGLPAGVTASFAPASTLSAFQAGTITLTATAGAVAATYPVTVQALFSEGGQQFMRSSTLSLNVAASAGVTGVKGRFVTPEGQGIAGVIVRADVAQTPQPQTTTDAAGNFQLAGVPPGPVTFRFDATPANPLYPIWPYTTTVPAGQISVIPDWTINPPPSDDKFVQISNATQNQSITDERFPGLEIKLPAGVTITGWDGVRKTRIAVEKIMPDKLPVSAPPFPMREAYQLYFGTPMGGIPSQPIPVTLPNVAEREPGEQVEIWFFDGSPMGGSGEWKLAGLGTVSPDGKTVASNPGVGIPRFCGVCGLLSLSCPPPPIPPQPPKPCPRPKGGNPVDLFTGQELSTSSGLSCSGLTPIETGMTYNPVDAFNNRAGTVGSLGFGWAIDYDIAFLPFEGPQKRLVMPGGVFVNFVDNGGLYSPVDNPRFSGATIRATNQAANEWELKFKDGRIWRFKPFAGITGVIRGGPPTFVTEMLDSRGNAITVSRKPNGRIFNVSGAGGRGVVMTYGANGFVSEIRDTADRTTRFTYNADDRLETVIDADGHLTRYTYVGDDEIAPAPVCAASMPEGGKRIKTTTYPGRPVPTTNFYGSSRRILRQTGFDGRLFHFSYKVSGACITHVSNPNVKCTGVACPTEDSWEAFQAGWRFHGGQVIGTGSIQPDGSRKGYGFGKDGQNVGVVDEEGQSLRRKYDARNRVIEQTDGLARMWRYEYDEQGNRTRTVDPLGRITDTSYDGRWNKPLTITRYDDPTPFGTANPRVWRYAYHATLGTLLTITDPLNRTITSTYTPQGLLESIADPLGHTTRHAYNAQGDLVSTIDPLGHESRLLPDGVGRTVATTDPLGYTSRMEFNGRDLVTRVTNPLDQVTRRDYDAAGRLTATVNPALVTIEQYGYDSNDRLIRKTDASGKDETYTHDSSGRISQVTNRNGGITRIAYDGKGRIVRTELPDGQVQTREYDAASRVVRIATGDSQESYAYDAANRAVQIVSVAYGRRDVLDYQYDVMNRLRRRTVNGIDVTEYTYDAGNQLTRVDFTAPGQPVRTTVYNRDGLGRLSEKVLANGIKAHYAYDALARITEIEYLAPNDSLIDRVVYTYDAAGNVLTRGTSSSAVQETPFNATYDAANRMTTVTLRPGSAQASTYDLAYDDNGNLIGKANTTVPADRTTFTWDARDRLSRIDAPGLTAEFRYDLFGRRVERLVNGQATRYVYDGVQAVLEISDSTQSMATGLVIDEALGRYSQTQNATYLTDALGSVTAQARDDSSILNFYAYSPYGEASAVGPDEGNAIQFTARENDGTGLYFYRARYYDPVLKRFISEDPIGLAGGANVYAYVSGNPMVATDPSGNTPATAVVRSFQIGWRIGEAINPVLQPRLAQLIDAVTGLSSPMESASKPYRDEDRKISTPAEEAQANSEREAYKNVCEGKPPPNLTDPCEILKWEINRAQQCIDMRQAWDDKWWKRRHEVEINGWKNRLRNLIKRFEDECIDCP